jgi:hypothetical protein
MAFITGTGVGAHTEDRVPLVIARLKGKEAVLRWAVAVYPSSQLSVSSEPVALAGGTAPRESEAAAMRISSESATNILAVNASGRSLQIAGQAVEARLAWLQGGPDGKFRVIAAAR